MQRVSFKGILIDRGRGTGARRFMLENPEREGFVIRLVKWPRLEAGSLTIDNATPLPLEVLGDFEPIGTEPQAVDLFPNITQSDVTIAEKRGPPSYYCGFLEFESEERFPVLLSQQPRPAKADRLEIYSSEHLRTKFQLRTGDEIEVTIVNPADWTS